MAKLPYFVDGRTDTIGVTKTSLELLNEHVVIVQHWIIALNQRGIPCESCPIKESTDKSNLQDGIRISIRLESKDETNLGEETTTLGTSTVELGWETDFGLFGFGWRNKRDRWRGWRRSRHLGLSLC